MRGLFPLCHCFFSFWHYGIAGQYMTTAIGGGFLSLNKTNLAQGETISGAQYKGPYPPHAYDHNYRIEVFALKQASGTSIGTFDNENNYASMVNQLNAVGDGDNIVGRGHIIGKYKNGDNNL
jgi:phosphatidylethanolamine-binding protein (PEBP) family uncharacterized protein